MTDLLKDLQGQKFRTICADPPWDYREYGCHDGPPKPWHDVKMGWKGVADMGYPTMKTRDIVAMPVGGLADTNAHLYCWTTNKFLREAHEVAEAWGFTPKTLLSWGKVTKDGKPHRSVGYYFASATEHVLFCVRGSLRTLPVSKPPTWFTSTRLPHSVKPEWFYALCEECSPGPRLELFARRKREGWTCWGNEVEANSPICVKNP